VSEQGQLGRREFLGRAGRISLIAAGGSLLAACGGGSSGASSAKPATAALDVKPATLKFVGWEGYDAPDPKKYPAIHEWMDQHSVKLTSTYTQTNEEMLTKIQTASPGTYNITSPYHGTVQTMIEAGVLEPIQVERMQNWEKIYEQIRSLEHLRGKDGKIYAVPLDFSYAVGLYNADKVQPLQRFADVIDNPSLKGKYVLIDALEHLTWIAQYLKLGNPDPHHLTQAQLQQCVEVARKVIANAKAVPGSFGDILQLMLTHEADYSLSGNPSDEQAAQKKGVNIKAFVPTEGTQTYVDNYCIPKGSSNYDTSLAWIDFVTGAKGAAEIQRAFGTGTVNPEAVPLLDPELKSLYDYSNIENAFKNAPVWPPIPAQKGQYATYSDWTKAWASAK
jgi:spermidine/putrescine-binding protein